MDTVGSSFLRVLEPVEWLASALNANPHTPTTSHAAQVRVGLNAGFVVIFIAGITFHPVLQETVPRITSSPRSSHKGTFENYLSELG